MRKERKVRRAWKENVEQQLLKKVPLKGFFKSEKEFLSSFFILKNFMVLGKGEWKENFPPGIPHAKFRSPKQKFLFYRKMSKRTFKVHAKPVSKHPNLTIELNLRGFVGSFASRIKNFFSNRHFTPLQKKERGVK